MNIAKLNQTLTAYFRRLSYGEQPRPARDWLIAVIVIGALLIASVSWSYWLFYKVSIGDSISSTGVAKAPVNPATLETVQQVFDARAAERAHYQNDYRFVDPSH